MSRIDAAASKTMAELFDAQRQWQAMYWEAMLSFPFMDQGHTTPQSAEQPNLPGLLLPDSDLAI